MIFVIAVACCCCVLSVSVVVVRWLLLKMVSNVGVLWFVGGSSCLLPADAWCAFWLSLW